MFKNIFIILAVFLVTILNTSSVLLAQDNKVSEAEFKVSGICNMCKGRIEKSVKLKEVKLAKWNKSTKILKVAYLSPAITVDSLMQRVAAAGHDTEKFKAPDSAYAKLHDCCLYRDGQNTH